MTTEDLLRRLGPWFHLDAQFDRLVLRHVRYRLFRDQRLVGAVTVRDGRITDFLPSDEATYLDVQRVRVALSGDVT